jgi:histidinol-phosphatase (PHP family)
MIYRQNLHTHSVFCDGKDTPREMAETAIEKGFDSIGFSGHSSMYKPPRNGMSPDGTVSYRDCINSLKEEYRDRLKIFCGVEFDMYSGIDLSGYDYVIGAVHFFKFNGQIVPMDRTSQVVQDVIDTHFGGDGMAYAKHFYSELARLPEFGKCDIVAHFDLLTKHCEKIKFFDEDSKEYRTAALEAMHALRGKIPFFEVNTGAISRGYRKTPYPAPFILDRIKEKGGKIILSSDCHNKDYLLCHFDECLDTLRAHSFDSIVALIGGKFTEIGIND